MFKYWKYSWFYFHCWVYVNCNRKMKSESVQSSRKKGRISIVLNYIVINKCTNLWKHCMDSDTLSMYVRVHAGLLYLYSIAPNGRYTLFSDEKGIPASNLLIRPLVFLIKSWWSIVIVIISTGYHILFRTSIE